MSAPANVFDLRQWKLQIPGPHEIKQLAGYSSKYFALDQLGHTRFWLDCAEIGTTANSEYVRSELRHLPQWTVAGPAAHSLAASIQVESQARPDKVTVMQIHGIAPNGGHVPPLLRIALNDGKLSAFVKTTNRGDKTESVALAARVGSQPFECTIRVQNGQLSVSLNGIEKLNRTIAYWQHENYFKIGCYPQAHLGTVAVTVGRLEVGV